MDDMAVFGVTIAVLFWVLCVIVGVCLALAPLFIWKWTKATARAVEENNRLLRILIQHLGRSE